MIYPNLSAEMSRSGYGVSDLAKAWGTTDRTARNRINGTTDITFAQCKKLRDALFNMRYEVTIPEEISNKARKAIQRMLEVV